MIPESVGTSPFGIFMLADEYLAAARLAASLPRATTYGPARLLAYHASELFLKTYLRARRMSVLELRKMGHDLVKMAAAGTQMGLKIDQRVLHQLNRVETRDDYVKARYTAVSLPGTPKIDTALEMASALRETVRLALNFDEWGMPGDSPWPDGEPADLIAAREEWFRNVD